MDFLWGKVRNTGIPKGNEIKKSVEFFQRISNRILEGSANFFRMSLLRAEVNVKTFSVDFFRGEKE